LGKRKVPEPSYPSKGDGKTTSGRVLAVGVYERTGVARKVGTTMWENLIPGVLVEDPVIQGSAAWGAQGVYKREMSRKNLQRDLALNLRTHQKTPHGMKRGIEGGRGG